MFFLDAQTGGGIALRVNIHAEHLFSPRAEICPKIDDCRRFSHAALLVGNCIDHTHADFFLSLANCRFCRFLSNHSTYLL